MEVDALEAKAEEQRKRKQDRKVATSSICENPRVSKLEERASAVEEVLENYLKRWENLLNDLGIRRLVVDCLKEAIEVFFIQPWLWYLPKGKRSPK